MTRERRAGFALALVAGAAVARATLVPRPGLAHVVRWCWPCDSLAGIDFVLNVLLFAPLGAALRAAGLRRRRAAALCAAASLLIELAQYFWVPGRVASAADVAANSLGGAAGAALADHWRLLVLPTAARARRLTAAAAAGWLAVLAGTAWLFAPASAGAAYRARVAAPDRGAGFTGSVLAASVAGVAAPTRGGRDAELLRARLRSGDARAEATVLPGSLTDRPLPVVDVVDERDRSVVSLAQDGENAVFAVRRHATAARFRTPNVTLWSVLRARANGSARSTEVHLAAWTERYRMYLSARAGADWSGLVVELRPTMGWGLFLPFEHTLAPARAHRFTAVWLALLIAPAGFYLARAVPRRAGGVGRAPASRPRAAPGEWLAAPSVIAAALAAGLVAMPRSLGLPAAYPWEWAGASIGLALGAAVGLATRAVR